MNICFGLSWPSNVMKSIRSRTAKGKSLSFLLLVEAGYTAGIIGKIITHTYNLTTVLLFYQFFDCFCGYLSVFPQQQS